MRQTFNALSLEKLREIYQEMKGAKTSYELTAKEIKFEIAKYILESKNYLNHFTIDAHQVFFSELLLSSSKYEAINFDRHKEVTPYFEGLDIKMTKKYVNLFSYYLKTIGLKNTVRKTYHFLVR